MPSQAKLSTMPKPASSPDTHAAPANLAPEVTQRLRTLAHDLSNSIETVMQACYLLGQAQLDEGNKRWLTLVDQAARDAARINREIRDVLRGQSDSAAAK